MNVLGWLLPHGVPEIGAILLCGAAGMGLGRAIMFPGQYTRVEALWRKGPQAALIVAGCFGLFAYAAIIESFFRQLVYNDGTRLFVAGLHLWIMFYWVTRVGRTEDEAVDSKSP